MKQHNSGSTLIIIVVMAAVASILAAALVTALLTTNTVSAENVKSQQAYFTARSAVNAAISKLNDKSDTTFSSYASSLSDNTDYTSKPGEMSGGGSYTVTLRKSGDKLKITGKGYYPSLTSPGRTVSTVTANLITYLNPQSPGANPLSNLIYVTDSQNSSINPSQCFGDILFTGSLALTSGSTVDGNIYIGGNLSISNGAHVTKNAYVAGNLKMAGDYVGGDAYCLGSVSFGGENNQIVGTLYYKGSVTTSNNTLPYFAPSSVNDPTLTFKMPLAASNADTVLPAAVSPAVRSSSIMITHSTTLINSSGTIISCENYADNNQPVIIDTTGGDIYLLVKNSISLQNRQFYVKGSNRLYIYIEGSGTTLTLEGGSPVIRMQNTSAVPNIFVIGGSGTRLVMHSAEITGAVYIPDGYVQIDGGVGNDGKQTGYAIIGSAAAKTAQIGSNIKLKFQALNLSGTPLAVLDSGGGTQQRDKTWQVESWSK